MAHHESSYETHDGKKLYLQAWEPDGEAKAAVLILHGLAEHSGRYAHLAAKLNQNGYAAYSFDGRGHGKSGLPRPSAYFKNLDDYLRDVDGIFKKIKTQVGNIPCFIFGHSMGGGIAVKYALDYRPQALGVLLSGPVLVPGADISVFLIKISSILSVLAPKLKVVQLDSTHLSHDPKEVNKYNSDDLVYTGKIPARTGAEMLRMVDSIQKKWGDFEYPVLIMHGTADRLVNVEGSKMLYEKAASTDKTLKLYEGLYHEIINELEKEKVMSDIIQWMDKRMM